MTPREEFRIAYRIARLPLYACAAAMKRHAANPYLPAAIRLRFSSARRFGIECSNGARQSGRSFKTAVRGNLRAARYRAATGYIL